MNSTEWTEEKLKQIPNEIMAKMFLDVLRSNEELKKTIELLTEQIRIMNQRSYGRKTESGSRIFEQQQFDFDFNEAEATASAEENGKRCKAENACQNHQSSRCKH